MAINLARTVAEVIMAGEVQAVSHRLIHGEAAVMVKKQEKDAR
tara:strand:- start:114 stop:242 length:129 start_codon:yes stop_codon:yes gene_type:complete